MSLSELALSYEQQSRYLAARIDTLNAERAAAWEQQTITPKQYRNLCSRIAMLEDMRIQCSGTARYLHRYYERR